MRIINKIIDILTPFLIASLFFIASGLIFKTIETIIFYKYQDSVSFTIILKSYINISAVFSLYSVIILPLYILTGFIHRKISQILISILFAILIALEIGLFIYSKQSNSLLGAELIIRPITETIGAIKTVVHIWVPISGIISISILYYLILHFFRRKILSHSVGATIFVTILIGATLTLFLSMFYYGSTNSAIKNYIQTKSYYCFKSSKTYLLSKKKYSNVHYDKEKIKAFIQENSSRNIINKNYPFERKYENSNVLAPYFKSDSIKPNIVIFILESMGREWNFPNVSNFSFTPFLDSLAQTGLYWKNCISTTKRSFGVIPSITGSLPFGVKGFQFGRMPNHNSLIKILKTNNYKTNVYYAGAFYFDAINDYLLAQNIDYMSENYYIHYEQNKTENNGYDYWGYHDSIMYAKILQDQNFLPTTLPVFNLIVTTSAHQDAKKNNPYFQRAYKIVTEMIASAPKEKKEYYLKRIDRIASVFYQDLCLKDFFENLKKRKDFENTIFVFTGDHASGMMPQNDLSHFHVPLIIWSPLLVSHKIFPALVSHNDFVPTIETLLREHYNLSSSTHWHWLGNGLDTSSQFVSHVKTVMFDYSDGYRDMIYNNYYYNNQLFEIQNENLELKEINDHSLIQVMQDKLELFKYIHEYVYLNNKLTKHSLFEEIKYETIKDTLIRDTLSILFEPKPHWQDTIFYPKTTIDGKWEKIKISITADIMFLTIPEDQKFYQLIIECKGQNMQNADYYDDYIHKFIMEKSLKPEIWYPLKIEKQFGVTGASDIKVKMFFCIGSNDQKNHSQMKNIRIVIEGTK